MRKRYIKTDLAFGVAGRAWAAVNDKDEVIELVPMEGYEPYYTRGCPEALEKARRVRPCPASRRAADELNTESFLRFREKTRKRLGEYPGCTVESGMASCGEFWKLPWQD